MAKSEVHLNEITSKIAKTQELISISYHEAGHVIYGLLHFFKIINVNILHLNGVTSGNTNYQTIKHLTDIDNFKLFNYLLNSEICMNYAGLVAEKHHFKKSSGSDKFPMVLKMGSEIDTKNSADLIKNYNLAAPGKKRYLYKKTLLKETLKKLQYYWNDVIIVAHALFNKKRLNFNDLKNLLTKKSSQKVFWNNQFKFINYIFDNFNSINENDIESLLSI